jgi:hypothetical protein
MHEGLTVARVSQLITLSRLSPPALDRLREILAKPTAAKEAFSLRKLFQVARLPTDVHLSTIDQMAHRSRLRRPPDIIP